LAAIIHADASTGSYAAASAVAAEATTVAPTPGGIHDVYVLFRGHEFNYGQLRLTLALPKAPPAPRPEPRQADAGPGRAPASARQPAEDGGPPRSRRTPSERSGSAADRLTLVVGAQVYPAIAWPANPRAQVRWSSSKESVASVTSKGKVTAVAPGTATIRVSSGGAIAAFRVKVVAKKPRSTA
jgi:hypothetical protein